MTSKLPTRRARKISPAIQLMIAAFASFSVLAFLGAVSAKAAFIAGAVALALLLGNFIWLVAKELK